MQARFLFFLSYSRFQSELLVYRFSIPLCRYLVAFICAVTSLIIAPDAAQAQTSCPAGQSVVAQEGFAIAAFLSNPSNGDAVGNAPASVAIGAILAEGTVDTGTQSQQTFFNSIDLEFTALGEPLLPENSTIILSVAQFFGGSAEALIQTSIDGINFTDIGTIGFGNTAGSIDTVVGQNIIQHVSVTLPAGGARYVRLNHQSGGFRVDGGQRGEICLDSVSAVAVDDSDTVTDVSMAIPSILNVSANDTLNGAPFPAPNAAGSTTILALSNNTALPPELTFDTLTGDVGSVQDAANGSYSFDYMICETSNLTNCAIATVTIVIDAPVVPGDSCPAGQSVVAQEGFAIAAFLSNPSNGDAVGNAPASVAIGAILAEGTVDTGTQSQQTFFNSIDLEFTALGEPLLPENSTIILSVAQFFGGSAEALIQTSIDGINFTDIGTIGFGNTAGSIDTVVGQNIIQHVSVTLPAGGARYVRLNQQSGGFRVDGGQRGEICQVGGGIAELSNTKTVEGRTNGQLSVPGSDVVYTIRIENVGDTAVDTDTIFLIDAVPSEVIFLNVPFSDSANNSSAESVFFQQFNGAGLNFDFSTDIGFSTATTAPVNFGQCTETLIAGENPDITFICFNPKGTMAVGTPNPSFEFKFITRIR